MPLLAGKKEILLVCRIVAVVRAMKKLVFQEYAMLFLD